MLLQHQLEAVLSEQLSRNTRLIHRHRRLSEVLQEKENGHRILQSHCPHVLKSLQKRIQTQNVVLNMVVKGWVEHGEEHFVRVDVHFGLGVVVRRAKAFDTVVEADLQNCLITLSVSPYQLTLTSSSTVSAFSNPALILLNTIDCGFLVL